MAESSRKRPRLERSSSPDRSAFHQEAINGMDPTRKGFISYWAEENNWPEDFFNDDPLLARRRIWTENTVITISESDQDPGEPANSPLVQSDYVPLVGSMGNNYIRLSRLTVRDEDARLCHGFFRKEQPIPENTIFRDDVFRAALKILAKQNQARLYRDITPLITPSAEKLAILGAKHLDHVVETVNECWNTCIPIGKSRPQPNFAVGFGASAFSSDHFSKLRSFLGRPLDFSYLKVTPYMYFPFLTTEVQCGTEGLVVADLKNCHSMAIAMNGIVRLFRRVGREREVHRRILGFSYSHNHQVVEIWGHYPEICGSQTIFRRHPIRRCCLIPSKSAEKWLAYTFTLNLYDTWVGPHLDLIRSAICDVPHRTSTRPQ